MSESIDNVGEESVDEELKESSSDMIQKKTPEDPKLIQFDEMKVLLESSDARLGGKEEIVSNPGDTISYLVDRYIDKCGGVVGSSGYVARNSQGNLLDMEDTLLVAGVRSGDTVHISCKNIENEGKSRSRQCPWYMLSLTCGLVCLVTMVVSITAWSCSYGPPDRYLVLLDAGSVHTSVYTYRYSYPEPAAPVMVKETKFCELGQTGISSFRNNPQKASKFISTHPCVLSSIAAIPSASRPLSSVLLGSTAGMRVLNLSIPETAHQILGNLTRELELVSMGMESGAKILGGQEEGVDGWVTANYLKGGIGGEEEMMGALDWGGASSQITRMVGEKSQADRNLTLYGKEFNLLARSNLCYGQAEALNRHKAGLVYNMYMQGKQLEQSPNHTLLVTDPCLPQGSDSKPVPVAQLYSSPCTDMADKEFVDKVKDSKDMVTFTSSQNQTLCTSTVLNLFTPTTCQAMFVPQQGETTCMDPTTIPLPGDMKYLAFSTYWYLTKGLGLGQNFILADFVNVTSQLCSAKKTSPLLVSLGPVADMACFQAIFMNHLLTKAYHFNSATWPQISFVKRIADAEVGWGLGHAIAQANSASPPEGKQYISLPLLLVLLSISGLLLLFCLASMLQVMCMRRQYTRLQDTA